MYELAIIPDNGTLDASLKPSMELAKRNGMEMQRLALDCTTMLQTNGERIQQLANQGFLARLWSRFSGERGRIDLENKQAVARVQQMSFRYLEKLHEEKLMTLDAVATIKNQLAYATSEIVELREQHGQAMEVIQENQAKIIQATDEKIAALRDSTKTALIALAEKMKDRLENMEQRIDRLETDSAMHGWLLTFEEYGYEALPDCLRLIRIVKDYKQLKREGWTAADTRYLKTALRKSGLDPESPVRIGEFIRQLAVESYADQHGREVLGFLDLESVDPDKVLQNVSLPALNSIYVFGKEFETNKGNIERLAKRHGIDPREELATQIGEILEDRGIESQASTELYHFAIELLTGVDIAREYGWKAGYVCTEEGCPGRGTSRRDVPGMCSQCGKPLARA